MRSPRAGTYSAPRSERPIPRAAASSSGSAPGPAGSTTSANTGPRSYSRSSTEVRPVSRARASRSVRSARQTSSQGSSRFGFNFDLRRIGVAKQQTPTGPDELATGALAALLSIALALASVKVDFRARTHFERFINLVLMACAGVAEHVGAQARAGASPVHDHLRHRGLAVQHRVSHCRRIQVDGAHGVIVARHDVFNVFRRAVGIHDGNDRDGDGAGDAMKIRSILHAQLRLHNHLNPAQHHQQIRHHRRLA